MLIICLLLFLSIGYNPCHAQSNTKEILIIASYSPDSKRVEDFIDGFSQRLTQKEIKNALLIESLTVSQLTHASTWCERLDKILSKYKHRTLEAIVLVGQEAWCASVHNLNFPSETPVFVVSASINGLTFDMVANTPCTHFKPYSVDMRFLAKKQIKHIGGSLYNYDFQENVKLIKRLFPNTQNVAFVSDYTYGGTSLKSFIQCSEFNFPDINFSYIDATEGEKEAAQKLAALDPETTTILMGTWRMDGKGRHLMHNSFQTLLQHNPHIPVISLTGTGIGSYAIGGYIPQYQNSGSWTANQIIAKLTNHDTPIDFEEIPNHFYFNKELMSQFEVREHDLPKDSNIFSKVSELEMLYRGYIGWIIVVFSLLISALLTIGFIFLRSYRLKNRLEQKTQQLIEAKEKAEQSDRMKSAFLANMSHEIRTPLNAIVGFSEILCENLASTDGMDKEMQQHITNNSDLLLSLIDDILDLSRLESGDAKFELDTTSVKEICEIAIKACKINCKKQVDILLEMPENDCIIYTDRRRINQVLNNLLSNAYKFTEEGLIRLSYEIDYANNKVLFAVEDTGSGIPLHIQNRIFNRFEKANEFEQGAGLGLSICRNILQHLHAEIWIDNNYTLGTKFVFNHEIRYIMPLGKKDTKKA